MLEESSSDETSSSDLEESTNLESNNNDQRIDEVSGQLEVAFFFTNSLNFVAFDLLQKASQAGKVFLLYTL